LNRPRGIDKLPFPLLRFDFAAVARSPIVEQGETPGHPPCRAVVQVLGVVNVHEAVRLAVPTDEAFDQIGGPAAAFVFRLRWVRGVRH
jgi:hypothetical protein